MRALPHRRTLLAATAAACLPVWASAARQRPNVAGVYTLPFEHLWVQRLHKVLQQAQQRGEIHYRGFENVPEHEYPTLLRKLAQDDTQVVFGESSFGESAVRRMAQKFPKTKYAWWSLDQPQAPNFSVFENGIYEPAYLAGMLGASLSANKHLGLVASFDKAHHRAIMNSFMAGAREIEPRARFSTGVIHSWFNPVRGRRMTEAMLAKGADTFLALTHAGVTETAFEHQALAFNTMDNLQTQYPNTVVAAVLWNPKPMVDAVLAQVRNHAFKPTRYRARMKNGGAELSPLNRFETRVPPEVLRRVRAHEMRIVGGQFVVPYNEALTFNTL